MRRDGRSARAGYGILLVAMAIQGLTPDDGNLASSWLLRLVSAVPTDDMAQDGQAPSMPTPPRGCDDDGVPGEFCRGVAAVTALRIRLDDGSRLRIYFLPAGLPDWPTRSGARSVYPAGLFLRGPNGLIPSLGRFRC
jgi:hypothetical protein